MCVNSEYWYEPCRQQYARGVCCKMVIKPGMEYSYSYLYSYLLEYFFSSTLLYSVLSKIHEYMYSYLLKYCYKKPCTHEYITSTTEYFFKFQSDRKKVNCFSGPPSSVSNAPHLSFFRLEKSGLICVLGNRKYK